MNLENMERAKRASDLSRKTKESHLRVVTILIRDNMEKGNPLLDRVEGKKQGSTLITRLKFADKRKAVVKTTPIPLAFDSGYTYESKIEWV